MDRKNHFKYLLLPLLVAAYPILFLYGHNASALELGSLTFPLGASLITAGLAYGVFCLILHKPQVASLSAVVFVILYFVYGALYQSLFRWHRFPVNHAVMLPLVIALAAAAAYLLLRVKPAAISVVQKVLMVASATLVVYNLLAVTVPVEAEKILANKSLTPSVKAASTAEQKKPDIYYIIFDEYAGADAVQNYWHDDDGSQLDSFLRQNNFFVATGSRSYTLNTGSEIASRLNLQYYTEKLPTQVKQEAIKNNKVMQVLKSYGYTTIAIDMAFGGIKSDIDIQFDPEEVGGMAADEFQKTFLDTTMFNAFAGYFQSQNQEALRQRDFVLYSLDKTTSFDHIQTPKFIYTHVLLPHQPFIFDENGKILPAEAADDWHYYLGQHKYATKLAQQLVSKLLENADPENPPVIIIQSDHGARNIIDLHGDPSHKLKDYPAADMFDILNAFYLPGFDTSKLSNNLDPLETFTIVLNHYLDAGLTVNPTPIK